VSEALTKPAYSVAEPHRLQGGFSSTDMGVTDMGVSLMGVSLMVLRRLQAGAQKRLSVTDA